MRSCVPPEIRAGPTLLSVPVLRPACIPAPVWRAWAATAAHLTRTAPTGSPASEQKKNARPAPGCCAALPVINARQPAPPCRPSVAERALRRVHDSIPIASSTHAATAPASPISACAFSGPPHADMGTDQNVRRRLVETSKALPCNAINRSAPKGDPAGGDSQTQKRGVCLTSSFPSARAQFRLSAPTLPSWRERARSRSLRHRDMAPPQRELATGSSDG